MGTGLPGAIKKEFIILAVLVRVLSEINEKIDASTLFHERGIFVFRSRFSSLWKNQEIRIFLL